jgi:hypothetical protein
MNGVCATVANATTVSKEIPVRIKALQEWNQVEKICFHPDSKGRPAVLP